MFLARWGKLSDIATKRAEYCFESTVSEKRTHWASLSFTANSVSSAKNSVSSLWHTNNRLRGAHWALSPELGEGQKNSLSSVSEAVLSRTVFGPSLNCFEVVYKGRAKHDHDHFWGHLAGPNFFIFGVPPDDAPNAPSTHWDAEKKPQKCLNLMCHQMPFWCGIRCKTFSEDYGCGCVWAVPECNVMWRFFCPFPFPASLIILRRTNSQESWSPIPKDDSLLFWISSVLSHKGSSLVLLGAFSYFSRVSWLRRGRKNRWYLEWFPWKTKEWKIWEYPVARKPIHK